VRRGAPDGTAVPQTSGCPTNRPFCDVFTQYAGNCTTVTDEAGNSRQSCVDGLGRMTAAYWKTQDRRRNLNYRTLYAYDALKQPDQCDQNGSNSANARTRSFGYDSLSHLASANNPSRARSRMPTTPTATSLRRHRQHQSDYRHGDGHHQLRLRQIEPPYPKGIFGRYATVRVRRNSLKWMWSRTSCY